MFGIFVTIQEAANAISSHLMFLQSDSEWVDPLERSSPTLQLLWHKIPQQRLFAVLQHHRQERLATIVVI